jgi:hypothetical protein
MKMIVEFTEDRLYKIYQEFVQTVNSEPQKVYIQTERLTKSFSGSLCSRESLLKSLTEAYIVLAEETVNEVYTGPVCSSLGLWVVISLVLTTNEAQPEES